MLFVSHAGSQIFIGKGHAQELTQERNHPEFKLEATYRVLKDQVSRARKDLLECKKTRFSQSQAGILIKRQMMVIDGNQPTGKYCLVNKVVESEQCGRVRFKLKPGTPLQPELKQVVKLLLRTEARKHLKYFACCKMYEEGGDMTPHQISLFLEYVR